MKLATIALTGFMIYAVIFGFVAPMRAQIYNTGDKVDEYFYVTQEGSSNDNPLLICKVTGKWGTASYKLSECVIGRGKTIDDVMTFVVRQMAEYGNRQTEEDNKRSDKYRQDMLCALARIQASLSVLPVPSPPIKPAAKKKVAR